jgi:hypothetical protein
MQKSPGSMGPQQQFKQKMLELQADLMLMNCCSKHAGISEGKVDVKKPASLT